MSIEELGSLGEFFSSIVVLISLIYISIQTKHTKLAVQAQAHQSRTDSAINLISTAIQSNTLIPIFVKLETNGFPQSKEALESLTPEEFRAYETYVRGSLLHLENMITQADAGNLKEESVIRALEILAKSNRAQDTVKPALAMGLPLSSRLQIRIEDLM